MRKLLNDKQTESYIIKWDFFDFYTLWTVTHWSLQSRRYRSRAISAVKHTLPLNEKSWTKCKNCWKAPSLSDKLAEPPKNMINLMIKMVRHNRLKLAISNINLLKRIFRSFFMYVINNAKLPMKPKMAMIQVTTLKGISSLLFNFHWDFHQWSL